MTERTLDTSKLAVVYLRQSTPGQVRDNVIAREEQYKLREIPQRAGFPDERLKFTGDNTALIKMATGIFVADRPNFVAEDPFCPVIPLPLLPRYNCQHRVFAGVMRGMMLHWEKQTFIGRRRLRPKLPHHSAIAFHGNSYERPTGEAYRRITYVFLDDR